MPIEGPPCTPFVPAQCPLFASPMRTQGVNARPHARRATPRIAAREGAAPALAARAGAAHDGAACHGHIFPKCVYLWLYAPITPSLSHLYFA